MGPEEPLEDLHPALRGAAVVETHVSTLFMVGDRVYKLKKPIVTDFLDFREPAARRRACEHEVELNRAFAPGVYLDVLEVRDSSGAPRDYLVEMRRMPEARRLTALLDHRHVTDELRRIAHSVAAFHSRAERSAEIDAAATPEALHALWRSTTDALLAMDDIPVDPGQVRRLATMAGRYITGRRELLGGRIAAGHVCACHGDLRAEDIFCLDDGPRILDCIEFDDRLRYTDVLADVGFLAMDLEYHNRPDLAKEFLGAYADFSGEHHPQSLAHFYIAYRALVRCKVAALRRSQTGDPACAVEAHRMLAIAFDHMERARSVITIVGGLPGTGKTTLATALADAFGWSVVRSDEVRRDVSQTGHERRMHAPYQRGIYTPELTDLTYAEMARRARDLLAAGESVILDASFRKQRWRTAIRALAEETDAELVELHLHAPRAVAGQRIQRRRRGPSLSDATPEIALRLAETLEAWPSAHRIDTTAEWPHCVNSAVHVIARTGVDRMPWIRRRTARSPHPEVRAGTRRTETERRKPAGAAR